MSIFGKNMSFFGENVSLLRRLFSISCIMRKTDRGLLPARPRSYI